MRPPVAITISFFVASTGDPDDDYLLEIAVSGEADFIVTGDADLTVLDPFRGIRIVGYREFKKQFEAT